MAQNEFENKNYFNQMNELQDNINMLIEEPLNTAEINKSIFENRNQSNSSSPNFPKTKSNFQFGNIKAYEDKKKSNQNNYKYNQNRNNPKRSIGNTTPNRSFLTKSKLSINSKNNSSYKNIKRKNSSSNYSYTNYNKSNISNLNNNLRNNSPNITYNSNFMKKDPNKELIIINKLTQEVEHIKNYCNELKRQFDNHCMIKNEKKEFDNIKKENIKLTAEVSILKDDVAELMKKFSLINNKIDSMQQENNNLKNQNKNLLNFISIMSNNSINGIKQLKTLNMNMNQNNNNNPILSIKNNINNQDLYSNNINNESMNIINLINNSKNNNNNNNGRKSFGEINNNSKLMKNSSLKSLTNIINNNNSNFMSNTNYNFNKNNNLNSEQIDFSISNSISKNFEKIQEKPQINNFRTINNYDSKFDYTNINTNTNTNVNTNNNTNLQSKINKTNQTIEPIGNLTNKNMKDNATDIVSLIQSNFNLTNQFRNYSNSNNKQNRYLIPKSDD